MFLMRRLSSISILAMRSSSFFIVVAVTRAGEIRILDSGFRSTTDSLNH